MDQKNGGAEVKRPIHQSETALPCPLFPAKSLDQTTYPKQGRINPQATLFAFDRVGANK